MQIQTLIRGGAVVIALSAPLVQAQSPADTGDSLVDQIIHDVIGRTAEAARREVQQQTDIDPFIRGYGPERDYAPAPAEISAESRQELRQLDAEHDRKIAALERELNHKLDRARAEFEREAAREDKPEKIRDKRRKLQEKADRAYATFHRKVGNENRRFDQKRSAILARARQHEPDSGRDHDRRQGPPADGDRGKRQDQERGRGGPRGRN